MAISPRTISIFGSLLVAVLLVGGAYLFSSPSFGALIADAQSGQELLKEYAKQDTDNDGLTDWEETLYKTDPNNPHSVDPNLTDGEAVAQGKVQAKFTSEVPQAPVTTDFGGIDAAPNTLTEQFSRKFYGEYLTSRGGSIPSSEEIARFVQDAVTELQAENAYTPVYSRTDIVAGASGVAALTTYAADLRLALNNNSPSKTDKDALDNFADFVKSGDVKALKRVNEVGGAYKRTAAALMKIRVPSEIADAHLSLANAYAALAESTLSMGTMDTDPLLAFVGLSQYDDAFTKVGAALKSVGGILDATLAP